MNILITGGTGFIGQELCPMLLREGHDITVITRSPEHHSGQQARNQRFISWDDDLVSVMEKSDAVINLAGENIFGQRWTEEIKERIYFSRVNGTTKLVEALKQAEVPPEVMISASAAGYYGDRGADKLKEQEPGGDDFLAKVCKGWEQAAKGAEDAGVRLVFPRIGIALEQGGGALQKMLPAFKFFVGGAIGHGTQFVPWIHRHDLCRGLLFPLQQNDFRGPYNLTAPNPVTMEDLAQALGDVMNRPSVFRVPEFVLDKVLGEASEAVLESLRVLPAHLQKAGFDFHFKYVHEALSDIL